MKVTSSTNDFAVEVGSPDRGRNRIVSRVVWWWPFAGETLCNVEPDGLHVIVLSRKTRDSVESHGEINNLVNSVFVHQVDDESELVSSFELVTHVVHVPCWHDGMCAFVARREKTFGTLCVRPNNHVGHGVGSVSAGGIFSTRADVEEHHMV